MSTFHQMKAVTADGSTLDFASLRGTVVLVVNTATHCGLSAQFKGLQELYEQYEDRGFVILGFPSNQFLQEPGSCGRAEQSSRERFGVTFPMMDKVNLNGSNAHPLFAWLKQFHAGLLGASIKWNFTKFLVGRDGEVLARFAPATKPENLHAEIEKALQTPIPEQ